MSNEDLNDGEIVERVRAGQISVFSKLVHRYQGPLLALAISRLGRRECAEEAVQESFLCAFRWLDSYDSKFQFRTWLWTILLNQCRRIAEKESRFEVSKLEVAQLRVNRTSETSFQPSDPCEMQENNDQIHRALRTLPTVHADALRLRFFGELKFEAIAQAMGCSLRTAKYRVKEAILKLSEVLGPEFSDALGSAVPAREAALSNEVDHAL